MFPLIFPVDGSCDVGFLEGILQVFIGIVTIFVGLFLVFFLIGAAARVLDYFTKGKNE